MYSDFVSPGLFVFNAGGLERPGVDEREFRWSVSKLETELARLLIFLVNSDPFEDCCDSGAYFGGPS